MPPGRPLDRCAMIWPAAALAILLCTFAIVYGSVVQSRMKALVAGGPDRDIPDATHVRDGMR